MLKNQVVVVGVPVMACGVLVNAITEHQDKRVEYLTLDRRALGDNAARLPLKVQRVRLEPAPPMSASPGTVLKFDLYNASTNRLADPLLQIAIVEKTEPSALRRILVGPFTIRGEVVLEAGYRLNYEMLLRNFSSDCHCLPNVEVYQFGLYSNERQVPANGHECELPIRSAGGVRGEYGSRPGSVRLRAILRCQHRGDRRCLQCEDASMLNPASPVECGLLGRDDPHR